VGEDSFSPDSYWWQFRRLLDETKGDPISSRPGCYPARNRDVRARFEAIEQQIQAELPGVMRRRAALRKESAQEAARFLDSYSQECVDRVLRAVYDLRRGWDLPGPRSG
jgi:hypothetical protein